MIALYCFAGSMPRMHDLATLQGLPDDLLLEVLPKLTGTSKTHLQISATDVPVLWPLANACKTIQGTFARCAAHTPTHHNCRQTPSTAEEKCRWCNVSMLSSIPSRCVTGQIWSQLCFIVALCSFSHKQEINTPKWTLKHPARQQESLQEADCFSVNYLTYPLLSPHVGSYNLYFPHVI
jgi:hypothetical protein